MTEKRQNMRALVTIAAPALVQIVKIICQEAGVEIRYEVDGEGTASQEWMDVLGLGSAEKKILISILTKEDADKMAEKLGKSLPLKKAGTGIVFTLPAERMLDFVQCQQENFDRAECWLVSVVSKKGRNEEVMDAARTVGASGGTVVHGTQIRHRAVARAWGLHHPEETEIVLILCESKKVLRLMSAVEEQCGAGTETGARTFAQPVDKVEGLHYYLH